MNGHINGIPREGRICRVCHIEIKDEYHFTCKSPTYAEIREKYQDILGSSHTLPKLLNIKKLGRYTIELKQHRENKLQNVDKNVSNIHQHVTNAVFQGQGETTNVDTPVSLNIFLDKAENQRRAKRPRMSGFKATRRGIEAIKKIRERELHGGVESHSWGTFYTETTSHARTETL